MARRQQRTARRLEIATPDPPNYRDFINYLDIATSALMARLNEPPVAPAPSADSLEIVKRRFLRQNRELAKTNSQQSIRIRTLENDCSRLLAENLSLREHVLQLQNALEAQPHRPSFENIDSVKSKLEAKMQELGGLVAELGQLQKQSNVPRYRSQHTAVKPSPEERQWRSGLGLQDVENAMMPTIVEDKQFPRKTMNADELQNILEDPDNQSPDIGPPPVSRFEQEDVISFDPSPQDEPTTDADPTLSVNLETRKKRRESGPKNIRRVSLFESPPEDLQMEDAPSKTVRAGAKRKFSVQEDDDKSQAQADTFRFSRRNAPSTSEDSRMSDESKSLSSDRPVLGAKPVNTDPVLSPKKQRPSKQDKSEKKPLVKPTRSRLIISRNVVQPELPQPQPQEPEPVPTAEIKLDSLPPKTPAPEDVFSPHSTEPSTLRQGPKDTPPPGEIHSEDQTGMSGRPSRRARPQVSYKEPSLNTKMRRPGKELVDAIYPQGRPSIEPQSASSTSEKIFIKSEPEGSAWKSMPSGTERAGGEEAEQGSPLRQKLDRKEGGQEAKCGSESEQLNINPSAVSNPIPALMSASNTKHKPPVSESVSTDATNDSKPSGLNEEVDEKMAVFEFTESSPADKPSQVSRIELAKAARSRRHSSVPTSSATEERKSDSESKKSRGALPSLHSRTGSGGSRGSTSSSLSKSTASMRMASREKRAGGLPSSGGSSSLRAKLDAAEEAKNTASSTATLRAERAASRRKSMML
ncbi:hypothetical protein BS50DRAFT_576635 [Corynespora cassiicola Philippines]|uniref:Shugoshin n=1 Tax=Corynespora cassiicola Philippines TaxID=1448308 RepID=A0A2T2NF60_CORCC|nr:hypothetical protein BS50DRAFT_576635 [Corynespora cassiicola Philippines]